MNDDDETREYPSVERRYGKVDLALFLTIGLCIGYLVGRIATGWYRSLH